MKMKYKSFPCAGVSQNLFKLFTFSTKKYYFVKSLRILIMAEIKFCFVNLKTSKHTRKYHANSEKR